MPNQPPIADIKNRLKLPPLANVLHPKDKAVRLRMNTIAL